MPDLTEHLDKLIEVLDEGQTTHIQATPGSRVYDALGLALAVSKLIDFGGGILKLASGEKFKFIRPCVACQAAVPMTTRSGIDSRFCPRCATLLASTQWDQRSE